MCAEETEANAVQPAGLSKPHVAQPNILSLLKTLEKLACFVFVLFCVGNSTGRRSNVNSVDSTIILECQETRWTDRLH